MDEIRDALAGAGHAVLQAPPGAGKTTVVPLRLLAEPWLDGRRILVLEPRRLATRAAAARMASLLGEAVGATVGFRTRDERRVGPATRVEVVTEGILTRRLQRDPTLPGVGLVVFDEVHERNLQTDLALALTLDVRAALRPDLRLLAMSATLDHAGIAALLGRPGGPAPVVVSEGREHPVDIRWAPPPPPGRRRDAAVAGAVRVAAGAAGVAGVAVAGVAGVAAGVAAAVRVAVADNEGDVLVFLPGAGEIRRVQAALAGTLSGGVDVVPLFGGLPPADQDRALAPSPPGRRRVVLATDIAETSLTVAGVRVVVDQGLARSPRYDPGRGLTRLHTGPASRSSADQRAGRAGRQGPGVAYRLWSEHEHSRRRPFPEAEITTVDLAGFVLELAVWGADAGDLAFLEAPPRAALEEGRALLVTLGALDEAGGRPTALGRRMADLPLHPRLARMVVDSVPFGRGAVACALAALLEDRDVLRGAPDDVGVDIAERVRRILGTGGAGRGHPFVDAGALAAARRQAGVLRRRAGVGAGAGRRAGGPADVAGGPREGVGGGPREGVGGGPREAVGGGPREAVGGGPREAVGGGPREAVGGGLVGVAAGLRVAVPASPPVGVGGGAAGAGGGGPLNVGGGEVDVSDCGVVLALAYPDRIAQGVGGGRFRLRTGAGAWVPETESLAGEAFLVVAQLDADGRDGRIRLAAALDRADLEAVAGAPVETVSAVAWDADHQDLRATSTLAIDGLVLATTERKAGPGPAATAALLQQVRATRLAALPWTAGARVFQQRVMFLGQTFGQAWPDLSDAGLLATIDEWLAPRLSATADLESLDLTGALRSRVPAARLAEVDLLAPASIALGSRRQVRVDYGSGQPTVAARIQDLFGTTRHPTVAGGRVPLVVQLLSPAGRPVQVTSDLPGFWSGSYAAVRKELAGRYPKHPWPADPVAPVAPVAPTGRASRQDRGRGRR